MPGKDLKNKPLIEAILEVKWALTSSGPGVQIDPHYKILLGRLYYKVQEDYPEHEQLPKPRCLMKFRDKWYSTGFATRLEIGLCFRLVLCFHIE